jgi:hypothetical protein
MAPLPIAAASRGLLSSAFWTLEKVTSAAFRRSSASPMPLQQL